MQYPLEGVRILELGQIIAGSRSTRWRTVRYDSLPAPMTIAARK